MPSLVIAAALAKNALLRTIEQHYISAKLSSAGSRGSAAAATPDEDSKLFEGLLGTIIANLQVCITRVHVRYEHPLALVPAPGGRGLDRCGWL